MKKHKTTLLLDADLWRRFQEEVTRQEGPRATSAEVEKLLTGMDPEVFEEAVARVIPPPEGGLPSLEEVERSRPRPRQEVAPLIRQERDERDDRVLGLQRGD